MVRLATFDNEPSSPQSGGQSPTGKAQEEVALLNTATRKRKFDGVVEEAQTPAPALRSPGFFAKIGGTISKYIGTKDKQVLDATTDIVDQQNIEEQPLGESQRHDRTSEEEEEEEEEVEEGHQDMAPQDGGPNVELADNSSPAQNTRARKAKAQAAPPTPTTRATRHQPAESRDIYDMPSSPETENVVISVKRAPKPKKGHAVTGATIIEPRITRAKAKSGIQQAAPLRTKKQTSKRTVGGNIAKPDIPEAAQSTQSTPSKRKRGRPVKETQGNSAQTVSKPSEKTQEAGIRKGKKTQKKGPSADAQHPHSDQPAEGAEEIDSISVNSRPPKRPSGAGNISNTSAAQPADEPVILEASQNPASQQEEGDQERFLEIGELPEGSVFSQDNDEKYDTLFGMRVLDQMLKTAELVGSSWNAEVREHERSESISRPVTASGKVLLETVKSLIQIYVETEVEHPEELIEGVPTAREIISSLDRLRTEAVKVHLSKQKRTADSIHFLQDLFFLVLPGLLESIWHAANLYTLRTDSPESTLKQMIDLSIILQGLSESALQHNSRKLAVNVSQPQRDYLFWKPTRQNGFKIREFKRTLEGELARRRNAEKRRERGHEWDEWDRIRLEEAERERHRRLKDIEDIRREQLRDVLKQFNMPITGPMALAELEQELWKSERVAEDLNGTMRKTKVRRVGNSKSAEVIPDSDSERERRYEHETGFDEEEIDDNESGIERVSVFGNDNRPRTQASEPWDSDMMLLFTIIMTEEHDNEEKYNIAASQLDRDLDDVFEYAKDLQETMNMQHEKGNFTSDECAWTYSIWRDIVPEMVQ